MASRKDLAQLTKARLKTVSILMINDDWDMAAYMMGYSLETALKAATCKTLRVDQYPDIKSYKNEKIGNYFMTHNFDMLLLVSGLSDIFSVDGDPSAFQNWSDFTQEFSGEWTNMRYLSGKFDSAKTNTLYKALYEDHDSIIKTITRRRKW